MTLANLKYLTQYLVGDPQLTTYSQQMYQDAINFACKDYATKTGSTYKEEPGLTVDSNGFVTIPTSYIRLQRVMYKVRNATYTRLLESTMSFEFEKSFTWETTFGLPRRWVLFAGNKIKLTPIPMIGASYPASIGYVETPNVLTGDSSTVDSRIPEAHHEYLKYAASAWLLLLDGEGQDFQRAEAFMSKFNQLIGYVDPVLDQKLASSRTKGVREV